MSFFFQAEDGIRDYKVTGVQTCALPIYRRAKARAGAGSGRDIGAHAGVPDVARVDEGRDPPVLAETGRVFDQIGRAACRGRGEISVGAGSLKKKKQVQLDE